MGASKGTKWWGNIFSTLLYHLWERHIQFFGQLCQQKTQQTTIKQKRCLLIVVKGKYGVNYYLCNSTKQPLLLMISCNTAGLTIWIWNATIALACLAITGPGVQIVSQGWKDGSETPGAILRDAQVRFQYSSQRASPSDRGLYPESWSQNAGSDNTHLVNIWQEEEIDEVVAGAVGEGGKNYNQFSCPCELCSALSTVTYICNLLAPGPRAVALPGSLKS